MELFEILDYDNTSKVLLYLGLSNLAG